MLVDHPSSGLLVMLLVDHPASLPSVLFINRRGAIAPLAQHTPGGVVCLIILPDSTIEVRNLKPAFNLTRIMSNMPS